MMRFVSLKWAPHLRGAGTAGRRAAGGAGLGGGWRCGAASHCVAGVDVNAYASTMYKVLCDSAFFYLHFFFGWLINKTR